MGKRSGAARPRKGKESNAASGVPHTAMMSAEITLVRNDSQSASFTIGLWSAATNAVGVTRRISASSAMTVKATNAAARATPATPSVVSRAAAEKRFIG